MTKKIDHSFVEKECSSALERLGFVMRRGVGTLKINDNFNVWVGLNAGKHEGFIRINPFIGIYCKPIMEMVAAAKGKKVVPFEIATFAVFLGTLKPDLPEFIFSDESDEVLDEASRLAAAVNQFGIPFALEISSLEKLRPRLKDRVPMLGGYPQRYAAALYLSGDPAGAISFIDSYLADNPDTEYDLKITLTNLKAAFVGDCE